MKRGTIGIIIVVILTAGAVTVLLNAKNKTNVPYSNSNNEKSIAKEAVYNKEDFSLTFNYPGNLSVSEINPAEPIRESNIVFHHQKPDFEVKASDSTNDSEVYIIALYKKTLNPSSLLGNYLATMTSDNGGPGQVIKESQEQISGIDYKILESSPGKDFGKKVIESAGNTTNGWTVYLLNISSEANSSNAGENVRSILKSLSVNESTSQNNDGKKICQNEGYGISFQVPSTFYCYAGPGQDAYFDVIGKYPTDGGKLMQVSYRFNFLKNIGNLDDLLDTKYSCSEGACPVYPVKISTVKINNYLFKISQSDEPNDPNTKTGTIVSRTIKAAGKIGDWTVGAIITGASYKRGIELPTGNQILSDLREIIGTIKVSQK